MTSEPPAQSAPAPPLAVLARTTAIALAVALVLLVAFVLPAEYAVDPLGIGQRLGLTEIAAPGASTPVEPPVQGAAMVPQANGPLGEYPGQFKVDVVGFVLDPYEFLEYKYQLEKGATMIYSWTASADVDHDFHGQRPAGATDGPPEESFDKRPRRQASASYIAPFGGIHGWYWENPGGTPISIRLSSAGFYTSAVEIRSNRTRHPHQLRLLETPAAQPASAVTNP